MLKKYKLNLNSDGVTDTETRRSIPNDPGNRHWREYQAWLIEGNTADSAETDANSMDRLSLNLISTLMQYAEKLEDETIYKNVTRTESDSWGTQGEEYKLWKLDKSADLPIFQKKAARKGVAINVYMTDHVEPKIEVFQNHVVALKDTMDFFEDKITTLGTVQEHQDYQSILKDTFLAKYTEIFNELIET